MYDSIGNNQGASVHRRGRESSEKFPLIRPDGKWTWTAGGGGGTGARASHRILSLIAGSIAWSALPRPLYCSAEKENEEKDGAEPRRQSATGNLKSCANTRAADGLDEEGGGVVYGGKGRSVGRLVSRARGGWGGGESIPGKRLRRRNYVVPSNS